MGGSHFGDGLVGGGVVEVFFEAVGDIVVPEERAGAQVLVRLDCNDFVVVFELDRGLVVEVGQVGWLVRQVLALEKEVRLGVGDCFFDF